MQWHDLSGDQQKELINEYLREQSKRPSPENVNRARDALDGSDELVLRLARQLGYDDMGTAIDNPEGGEDTNGQSSINIEINVGR